MLGALKHSLSKRHRFILMLSWSRLFSFAMNATRQRFESAYAVDEEHQPPRRVTMADLRRSSSLMRDCLEQTFWLESKSANSLKLWDYYKTLW
jgi:hypothetical protein